jgi:hypothetical protein
MTIGKRLNRSQDVDKQITTKIITVRNVVNLGNLWTWLIEEVELRV